MLVYAAMLGCVGPMLTIAAALATRSPFVSPLDKRDAAATAHKAFAEERSDHLAILAAFNAWQAERQVGR